MQMIIASRLTDGRVVFMGDGGEWVESIQDGVVLENDTDAVRLMSMARQSALGNIVVDPYFIDVVFDKGNKTHRVVLAHVREAIRAFGPSVRTELARRANHHVSLR